jgi:hypothetical protein
MKTLTFKSIVVAIAVTTSIGFISCKNKSTDNGNTSTPSTVDSTNNAPVAISSDENLRTGVKDATKDYPSVTATVDNGEITLTGTLQRDKLPKLMQNLNSLNPKKVNNQLTLN